MPIGRLSVGRDNQIDIFFPILGGSAPISVITKFDAKPETTELKSKGMDGIVRHGVEPDGWQISIELDRANDTLDTLFALIEDAYYRGVNIDNATVIQTVQEADGSVSQYRYTDVAFKFDDAGSWSNGKHVSQKLTGRGSRRIKIA